MQIQSINCSFIEEVSSRSDFGLISPDPSTRTNVCLIGREKSIDFICEKAGVSFP